MMMKKGNIIFFSGFENTISVDNQFRDYTVRAIGMGKKRKIITLTNE